MRNRRRDAEDLKYIHDSIRNCRSVHQMLRMYPQRFVKQCVLQYKSPIVARHEVKLLPIGQFNYDTTQTHDIRNCTL